MRATQRGSRSNAKSMVQDTGKTLHKIRTGMCRLEKKKRINALMYPAKALRLLGIK